MSLLNDWFTITDALSSVKGCAWGFAQVSLLAMGVKSQCVPLHHGHWPRDVRNASGKCKSKRKTLEQNEKCETRSSMIFILTYWTLSWDVWFVGYYWQLIWDFISLYKQQNFPRFFPSFCSEGFNPVTHKFEWSPSWAPSSPGNFVSYNSWRVFAKWAVKLPVKNGENSRNCDVICWLGNMLDKGGHFWRLPWLWEGHSSWGFSPSTSSLHLTCWSVPNSSKRQNGRAVFFLRTFLYSKRFYLRMVSPLLLEEFSAKFKVSVKKFPCETNRWIFFTSQKQAGETDKKDSCHLDVQRPMQWALIRRRERNVRRFWRRIIAKAV